MSFHFYLYRAEEGLPAMSRWTDLHAEPLGSVEQIRLELSDLFPQLAWEAVGDAWHGFRSDNPCDGPYLDILLAEHTPGRCHFVVLNKAPPSVMRKIMERLELNHVCAPEAGDLVDPYAYGDDDQYYAVRGAAAEGR